MKNGPLPEGVDIFIKPLDILSGKQKFEYPKTVYGQVNVSFMMPMYGEQNIDLNVTDKKSQLRKIITDFYMGSITAIQDLRSKGLVVNYHVYDTKNSISTIKQLTNDPFIQESDIIIGPFFFNNAEHVAKHFKDKIVVSPIYSKSQRANNSKNLIKTGINPKELNNKLTDYLTTHHTNQKVILITNYSAASKAAVIERGLRAKGIAFTKILPSANKKDANQIYVNKEQMTEAISETVPNWVILISDNEIVMSDVISTYGVLASRAKITLFTNREIDEFNHININYLTKLKWSFPVLELSGLDNPRTTAFSKKYNNLYNDLPSKHAYAGYDITYDILNRYSTQDFYENLKNNYSEGMSRVFDYEKSFRDYENKGVFMVEMNDNYGFQIKH